MPTPQSNLSASLRGKAVKRRHRAAQSVDDDTAVLLAEAEELEALARAIDAQETTVPVPSLGPVKWGAPWKLRK